MASTTTLAQLRTACYNTIKQPEDCKSYPYALLDTYINRAIVDTIYGTLKNPATRENISSLALPFAHRSAFYKSCARLTLSDDVTAGSAVPYTIDIPSTSLSDASIPYLWVKGEIVSVDSIPDDSSITTRTSLKYSWQSGSRVFTAYEFPSDFGTLIGSWYDVSASGLQYKMIPFDYRDFREPTQNSFIWRFYRDDFNMYYGEYYYTIIETNITYTPVSTGIATTKHVKLFVPFLPQSGNAIRMEYNAKPTTLTLSTDVCDIPDEYCLTTIPYLATSMMLQVRGEPDVAAPLYQTGYNNVETMFQSYNQTTKELIYNQRIRSIHDGILNI